MDIKSALRLIKQILDNFQGTLSDHSNIQMAYEMIKKQLEEKEEAKGEKKKVDKN